MRIGVDSESRFDYAESNSDSGTLRTMGSNGGMTIERIDRRSRRIPASFRRRMFAGALALAVLTIGSGGAVAAKFASIVLDADSGRILQSTSPTERIYPASLTKMMTLYLIFDALEAGKITLDTTFTVSARAARQPPSKLGLKAGETIKVRDVIPALIIRSANDVASTAADNLGGGEVEFATLMRKKARELGMTDTVFRNSSGLPHSQQMTTVRDLAILARALIRDHPNHYRQFRATSFVWRGVTITSHNTLVEKYPGADGLKTGFISASGFNLATSAVRDGRRLIGVVVGGASPNARDSLMADLLDASFEKIGTAAPMMAASDGAPPLPRPAPARMAEARTLVAVAAAEQQNDEPPVETDSAQGDADAEETGPGWAIQVGAFSSRDTARALAEKASSLVPAALVTSSSTMVTPLQLSNGKTIYRARVAGLSQDGARRACRALAVKKLDCIVVSSSTATKASDERHAARRET